MLAADRERLRRIVLGEEHERPARSAVPRVLIYAPGGGLGHVTRAAALARALGVRTTLWHHARRSAVARSVAGAAARARRLPAGFGSADAREALVAAARAADVLVVDTFPAGLAGEVDDRVLALFRRRVLVARHVREGSYPDHAALAARYDARLLPYPAVACEWEGSLEGEHVGWLLRDLGVADEPAAPLAVLGDAARLPLAWRRLLPPGTREAGGWVERLPRAERYLSVGAGYNATYELARLGVPHGLVPLERRFDDQFRRAGRLGVALHARADLEALLASPPGARPWTSS